MCAAALMLDAGVGVLRTVAPPDERSVASLRRAARALRIPWPPDAPRRRAPRALPIPWPPDAPAGDVLDGLDRSNPRQAAFLEHAVSLLRGAGYTPFNGPPPEQRLHSGIGAPYAHVTAPLRRLVDRFGTEVCLAAHAR